jgi:hypothetical protein
MNAGSAFAVVLQRPLILRERGDDRIDRIRNAADTAGAANQADSRIPQWIRWRLLNQRPGWSLRPPKNAFLAGASRLQRCRQAITNAGTWPEWAGFVLNAPLSSVICR